jgi:hypothetical protein
MQGKIMTNTGNRCFENVAQFRCLGTITNQNLIQEEIKGRLTSVMLATIQSRTAFSRLLSKNIESRIYKSIILLVVFYGCKTSSLTLRAEHKLRVFEYRVLRRIFGLKRDEVIEGWRKLHNERHDLYFSPCIIRVMSRMSGQVM